MPDELGVRYICRRDDPVLIDERLSVLQVTDYSLDNDSPPAMPIATASTSHISDSEPSELLLTHD